MTARLSYAETKAASGEQHQQDAQRWLFAPDPSINHNAICDVQHHGTATWLIQGDIYQEWKRTGSLLWIYGKRNVPFALPVTLADNPVAGSGKSVLWCVAARLNFRQVPHIVNQLFNHKRHRGKTADWSGIGRILLFRLQRR